MLKTSSSCCVFGDNALTVVEKANVICFGTSTLITRPDGHVITSLTTWWHQCTLQQCKVSQKERVSVEALQQEVHGGPVISCDLREKNRSGRLTSSDQQ